MKKSFLKAGALALAAALQLGAVSAFADTWDGGAGDGLWSSATNWLDDSTPTSADAVVLDNTSLAGSYTVTLDGTQAAASVQVGYSGNANTITLLIPASNTNGMTTAGVGTAALTIAGAGAVTNTLIVEAGGVLNNSSGHATAANVAINNGIFPADTDNRNIIKNLGSYIHNAASSFASTFPGGAVASGSTWESNSTVEFQQGSSGTVSFNNRTFGNLVVSSTSTKSFNSSFATPAGGGAGVVAGTFTIGSGCSVGTTSWGSGTAGNPLTQIGNVVNNGVVFTPGALSAAGATSGFHVGGAPTIFSGTGINRTSTTVANSVTVDGGATLQIASSAIFTEQNADVIGTGGFTLSSGANINIIDALGVNNFIQTSGTNSLSTGANYGYTSTAASQATGTNLPATVNNLTINNTFASATVTASQAIAVAGALTLTAGRLVTTATNSVTVAGAVTRTAGRVEGDGFLRSISGTGSRTFDVGTASGYTPVTINFTAVTGTDTFKVVSVDAPTSHPNAASDGTTLDRYWTLTPGGGLSGITAAVTFTWLPADVDGAEASYVAGRHLGGSSWQTLAFDAAPAGNSATVSGVTAFSDWTAGEAAGVPVNVSKISVD